MSWKDDMSTQLDAVLARLEAQCRLYAALLERAQTGDTQEHRRGHGPVGGVAQAVEGRK